MQELNTVKVQLFTRVFLEQLVEKIVANFDNELHTEYMQSYVTPMLELYKAVQKSAKAKGNEAVDCEFEKFWAQVLYHVDMLESFAGEPRNESHAKAQKKAREIAEGLRKQRILRANRANPPLFKQTVTAKPIRKTARERALDNAKAQETPEKPVVVPKQPLKPQPRKMIRLIIAGGRDYELTTEDQIFLESLIPRITCVVSGGARGADRAGERFAKHFGLNLKVFKADWDKLGKSAGYRRNEQMAEFADAMVVFPGGKGSQHMVDIGTRMGLEHIVAPHHCNAADEIEDASEIAKEYGGISPDRVNQAELDREAQFEKAYEKHQEDMLGCFGLHDDMP